MGRLTRAHDWASTPLGLPDDWSQSLRTAVRLILNTRHPVYIFWGAVGTCLYNDAYRQSIGNERHPSSLGREAHDVWDEIWPIIGPQIDQVMAGRGATWHENHLIPITRDGNREDVFWTYSYSPIDDETAAGGIGGVMVICTETTQQVLNERRIAALNARQRVLLQQMPGFVCGLAGPEHIYEYVNDAYITISGPRDFVGHPVREVFPEVAGQGFFELLDNVYATGEPYAARTVPIRFAGESGERHIDFLYAPIHDDDDHVSGIFVGGYDVTEQVRAQSNLREANATLEERVATEMREREVVHAALIQSQKMEAVGQLTGGLAHDFNNLLMAITGSLQLLRTRVSQGRTGEIDRYIDSAQGAARRAAALTHRLLAFSRRQTLEPKVIDINLLVTGMEELVRRTMGPGISLTLGVGVDLWAALVDPSQLENALLNLCINARDAMPDGGKLSIETVNSVFDQRAAAELGLSAGVYVCLRVSDSGTGMTPEIVARAFDPFFTTKPMGEGTGLGLSMIYGFARQSGGQVNIQSEAGHGSAISIYLPRHIGEVASDEIPLEPAERPAGNSETVLVVDDESTIRMLVVDVLQDSGYATLDASDGRTALALLDQTSRIDLLLTDVGLPGGMNGRQLADAARIRRPGLKVLFITGYAETSVLSDGQMDPGMHVLTKPFPVEALAQRIRDLLAVH